MPLPPNIIIITLWTHQPLGPSGWLLRRLTNRPLDHFLRVRARINTTDHKLHKSRTCNFKIYSIILRPPFIHSLAAGALVGASRIYGHAQVFNISARNRPRHGVIDCNPREFELEDTIFLRCWIMSPRNIFLEFTPPQRNEQERHGHDLIKVMTPNGSSYCGQDVYGQEPFLPSIDWPRFTIKWKRIEENPRVTEIQTLA